MKKVYLDNAATTQLRPEVILEITRVLTEEFGNPSSTHSFGRSARNIIELSRKTIAKALNAAAQEILFTSGATEANNWILQAAVTDLAVRRIITSKVEHHAVLHAVERLALQHGIRVDYVRILPDGAVDLTDLVTLLSDKTPTLVSLMHVNNETGATIDLGAIGRICRQHGAYFHSDTVQSVGKSLLDLQQLPIDFIVASAHKFHGPKGVGFAFIRKGLVVQPLFFGGEQEKGLRPGTEAVHNIAGMAKALEISLGQLEAEQTYIADLRQYASEQIMQQFSGTKINSSPTGFYNILNVSLPLSADQAEMLLFRLDMKGIAISRGSACQSGSAKPSHVLAEMLTDDDLRKTGIRISFSHYNTREDIDLLIGALLPV